VTGSGIALLTYRNESNFKRIFPFLRDRKLASMLMFLEP